MITRKLMGVVLAVQLIVLAATAALLGLIPGVGAQFAWADSARHFSLLAETMQPLDSTIGYNNDSAYLTTIANSTELAYTAYIGQIDLPDGARIVGVRCYGNDTDPTGQFIVSLFRYTLWGEPVWQGVAGAAYSGYAFSGGKVMVEAAVDADMALVDNAEFSYGIFLELPQAQSGQLGVLRCVVDTTYTVALPLVQK